MDTNKVFCAVLPALIIITTICFGFQKVSAHSPEAKTIVCDSTDSEPQPGNTKPLAPRPPRPGGVLVEYENVWRFLEDTTFYDPDRYGVILREKAGTYKQDYAYQCNFGWNVSFLPLGSDADDTYYVISNIQGFNTNRRYFKLEK